jgi:hypothetical protein
MSSSPRQIASRELAERRTVLERIDALTPSDAPAKLATTLERVASALVLSPSEAERLDWQELHFLTDLQRSTWAPDEGMAKQLASQLNAIEERAAIYVHDVGRPNAANMAVVELTSRNAYVTVGRPATFDARLQAFGDEPKSAVTLEFLVDGLPVGQQTVDIAAGGEATARFTHPFREPGSHVVAVRVDGDRLEIDNTRWLAVDVKEHVNVLCVGGSIDDVRFLADALNPDPADGGAIRPTTITEGELGETDLAEFDCEFLSNVSQVTNEEATRLARYVEQGGGLAIFLGDHVVVESYNAATVGDAALLPVRLGEVASETRFGLDPLDYRHSIVAPFRGRERAGLISTPVRRSFRLLRSPTLPL